MKFAFAFLLSLGMACAQSTARASEGHKSTAAAPAELSQKEEEDLSNAVAEAGSSPVEFLRAIEKHLAKYPDSPRKSDLERAAVKAAIEAKDDRRILLYGERVLARDTDDLQILERVTRVLLASDGRDEAGRAMKYARRYEELVRGMMKEPPPGRVGNADWREELDRGLGRALVFQARAAFNLGRTNDALELAKKSYEAFPNAESAREIARVLDKSGRHEEALPYFADAFTIPDPRNTDTLRARDRARMGEIYKEAKGGETGLGDLILQAYDRNSAIMAARRLRMSQNDPNAQLTDAMQFTLGGVDGSKLQLAGLKGKTVIFDFWATWCGPCRAQHPLYESVKKRFAGNADVVFLSINTDEEKESVTPFLKDHGWKDQVWYEDGLARVLQISSIPTTVIMDRNGRVFSRMNGYVPERFVDMLSERIEEALKAERP